MRIAVTGGLGFIGLQTVRELQRAGHEVLIIDHWDEIVTKFEKAKLPVLDVMYEAVTKAACVERPQEFLHFAYTCDAVVHLGACVDTLNLGDNPKESLWDLNVRYTDELVRAIRGGPKIVFASSAAVYGTKGHPNNPYGLSKAMGETLVKKLDKFAILRFFNVFGQFEHHKGVMASVAWKLAQAYSRGDKFEMHSPDAMRDFVPVQSVVASILKSLHEDARSGTFDVGTGEATSFADLDNFIMQEAGQKVSCVKLIDQPLHLAGRFQGFTKAGLRATNHLVIPFTTRQGIELNYGK